MCNHERHGTVAVRVRQGKLKRNKEEGYIFLDTDNTLVLKNHSRNIHIRVLSVMMKLNLHRH